MIGFPKRGKIKLEGDAYRELVERVFTRDHWQCRKCGSPNHLDPHHLIERSNLRLDTLENLCTLCRRCHDRIKARTLVILPEHDGEPLNANKILRFRTPERRQNTT